MSQVPRGRLGSHESGSAHPTHITMAVLRLFKAFLCWEGCKCHGAVR